MGSGISAPPLWMTVLEVRALGERAHMSAALPLLHRLPTGDGHPVLVLPGYSASDRSTDPLRNLLRRLGYRTYGWGLGVNVGPSRRILDGLVTKLDQTFERRAAPVSIVGWSLGGVYARELARARPHAVRQVITLGSPIRRSIDDVDPPLPTPTTSIYSRTDGIVSWRSSLVRRTATSENVRVVGSHCGLGFNAAAITVIADRLAQPARTWSPFSPPWYLRAAFPPASDLEAERTAAAAVA
jgi:pimeloyl-ACP methyl ester carboxylesterase